MLCYTHCSNGSVWLVPVPSYFEVTAFNSLFLFRCALTLPRCGDVYVSFIFATLFCDVQERISVAGTGLEFIIR